jgi:hypothetical protein
MWAVMLKQWRLPFAAAEDRNAGEAELPTDYSPELAALAKRLADAKEFL